MILYKPCNCNPTWHYMYVFLLAQNISHFPLCIPLEESQSGYCSLHLTIDFQLKHRVINGREATQLNLRNIVACIYFVFFPTDHSLPQLFLVCEDPGELTQPDFIPVSLPLTVVLILSSSNISFNFG